MRAIASRIRFGIPRRPCFAWLAPVIAGFVILSHAGQASADALSRFIWLHQCPIVERLEIIARTSDPADGGRFVVVAIEGLPQRYVQCLLLDQDTAFYCEASSGEYGPGKGQPGHLEPSTYRRAQLAGLGFDTSDASGNYKLEMKLTRAGRFEEVAALMLASLFRGYGAWSGTPLVIRAPLAPELSPGTSQCVPVG